MQRLQEAGQNLVECEILITKVVNNKTQTTLIFEKFHLSGNFSTILSKFLNSISVLSSLLLPPTPAGSNPVRYVLSTSILSFCESDSLSDLVELHSSLSKPFSFDSIEKDSELSS